VTEFITFPEEIAKPWTKLVGFVAGILLFISVFLPWQSVSYVMYSISCSGLCVSGGIGATGIVAGLICILAACLVNPKATGALHISMGILSLLVMLAIWFSHPTITGGGIPEGVSREEWEQILGGLRGIVHTGAGFYLYLVSSVVSILGGLLCISYHRENDFYSSESDTWKNC